MNILLIDQFGQLGGAQRCLLDLVPAFQKRGWQLRFAIAEEGPFPEILRSFGTRIDILPGCVLSSTHKSIHEAVRYLSWYPKAERAIGQIAAEFKPDLFYINGPRVVAAGRAFRQTKRNAAVISRTQPARPGRCALGYRLTPSPRSSPCDSLLPIRRRFSIALLTARCDSNHLQRCLGHAEGLSAA